MGDLDFAHGIPPERFRCKVRKSVDRFDRICTGRCPSTPKERSNNRDRQAIHWSLDEGRWIFVSQNEARRQVETKAERERNPFVRFKQFVDNGIGALNLVRKQRELNELQEREGDAAWQRWTGLPPDARNRTPVAPRSDAIKTARYLLELADRRVYYDKLSRTNSFSELFRDDQNASEPCPNPMLGLGAWTFCPEVADNLPSTAGLFHRPSPPPPRWLTIDWFKRSPYSPIQTEGIDGMTGREWRDAFEDLMLASTGRELEHLTQRTRYKVAGIDWVFSLQTRGILPPLLPSFHRGRRIDWPHTVYQISPDLFDYKEFSYLVDEIWHSHRASEHDWLNELRHLLWKNVPGHMNENESLQWNSLVESVLVMASVDRVRTLGGCEPIHRQG